MLNFYKWSEPFHMVLLLLDAQEDFYTSVFVLPDKELTAFCHFSKGNCLNIMRGRHWPTMLSTKQIIIQTIKIRKFKV